jgi:hypothetical protein
MLTKSKLLAGLQCEKRLFLQVHRSELEDCEAGFVAIQFGNELGEHARRLFPGGRLIDHVYDREAVLRETADCLAQEPYRALSELAFQAGGLFVRAFAALLDPETTGERRDRLQRRRLEYCARDTEAMVRLAHFLQGCGAPVAA